MKEIEIERKFLVKKDMAVNYVTKANDGVRMTDYYVPNNSSHWDLRIRSNDNKYCITRKRPLETGVMEEITIPLSKTEFLFLTANLNATSVTKLRFKDFSFYGHQAVLDVYEGKHEGLIIIEIEFKNKQEFDDFAKHDLEKIGLKDITGVEKYAAGKLAEW